MENVKPPFTLANPQEIFSSLGSITGICRFPLKLIALFRPSTLSDLRTGPKRSIKRWATEATSDFRKGEPPHLGLFNGAEESSRKSPCYGLITWSFDPFTYVLCVRLLEQNRPLSNIGQTLEIYTVIKCKCATAA